MLGFFFSSLTLPQSNIIRKRHSKMVMPNHFVANPLLTERKKKSDLCRHAPPVLEIRWRQMLDNLRSIYFCSINYLFTSFSRNGH